MGEVGGGGKGDLGLHAIKKTARRFPANSSVDKSSSPEPRISASSEEKLSLLRFQFVP